VRVILRVLCAGKTNCDALKFIRISYSMGTKQEICCEDLGTRGAAVLRMIDRRHMHTTRNRQPSLSRSRSLAHARVLPLSLSARRCPPITTDAASTIRCRQFHGYGRGGVNHGYGRGVNQKRRSNVSQETYSSPSFEILKLFFENFCRFQTPQEARFV
jgi:hypothetical protein